MSAREAISLAHTARCKLQLAADKPDRNLRFILGHAFTLDKLRLRVLEIESSLSDGDDDEEELPVLTADRPRRVSFTKNAPSPRASNSRNRSPPAEAVAQRESSSNDDFDDEEEDDEEDEGLELMRFGTASAKPPRMVEDEDSSDDDVDEPISPPPIHNELKLQSITEGPENEELPELYDGVSKCRCHGHTEDAPRITRAWDIPQKAGYTGNRVALVEVEA